MEDSEMIEEQRAAANEAAKAAAAAKQETKPRRGRRAANAAETAEQTADDRLDAAKREAMTNHAAHLAEQPEA